jgi:hypothetical protein
VNFAESISAADVAPGRFSSLPGADPQRQLRVLVVSHLWPRPDFPHLGIFVADQVRALSRLCRVAVAAPVDRTIRREELSLKEIREGLLRYRRRTHPHFLSHAGIQPLALPFRGNILR